MPLPNRPSSDSSYQSNKDSSANSRGHSPRGEVFDANLSPAVPAKNYKKAGMALGFSSIVLAIVYTAGAMVNQSNKQPVPVGPFPSVKVETVKPIVNIIGQVKKPGVYTLKENARIQDAIVKAGGALPTANLSALNLAAWVEDGSKIVVPAKMKPTPTPLPPQVVIVRQLPPEAPQVRVPVEQAPITSVAPPPAVRPIVPPTSTATQPATSNQGGANSPDGLPRDKTESGATSSNVSPEYLAANPLNINTATSLQLEGLPDIGPKTAEKIIAYRTANGSFRSVEELDNVKGIGVKTLAGLRPYVTVQ